MNLVDCLNWLSVLNELDSQWDVVQCWNKIDAEVKHCEQPFEFDNNCEQIRHHHQQLIEANQTLRQSIDQLKQHVKNHLASMDKMLLTTSYQTWEGGERHMAASDILSRTCDLDSISREFLSVRLNMKTGWQMPAMVIRPAKDWLIDNTVACDPMYYVDFNTDLLAPTDTWFTPEYQQRLCKYVFDESVTDPMFGHLPADQFGLIYVPYFLNFRPLEIIEKYLSQLFVLLRPGGYLLFTFNNCDTVSGAKLFERFCGSYTPARLLKPIIDRIGYSMVYEFNDDRGLSWFELQRPGYRSSIRAGQVLAAVKTFSPPPTQRLPDVSEPDQGPPIEPDRGPPIDIDPHNDIMYTEVSVLLSVCDMLNIPREKTLVKAQPSVKKMRKLIAEHLRSDNFPAEKITRLLEKRKSQ